MIQLGFRLTDNKGPSIYYWMEDFKRGQARTHFVEIDKREQEEGGKKLSAVYLWLYSHQNLTLILSPPFNSLSQSMLFIPSISRPPALSDITLCLSSSSLFHFLYHSFCTPNPIRGRRIIWMNNEWTGEFWQSRAQSRPETRGHVN